MPFKPVDIALLLALALLAACIVDPDGLRDTLRPALQWAAAFIPHSAN
jgi:hypothetical protein